MLRLFKMVATRKDCFRLQQKSAINFFMTKKCKQCEFYRWMCNVYREECSRRKDIYE